MGYTISIGIALVFGAMMLSTLNIFSSVLILIPSVFGVATTLAELEAHDYEVGAAVSVSIMLVPTYFTLFAAGLTASYDFSHKIQRQ